MSAHATPLAAGLLMAPYTGELPPLDPGAEAGVRERIASIPIFANLGFSERRLHGRTST
jgi:hypothetical protein